LYQEDATLYNMHPSARKEQQQTFYDRKLKEENSQKQPGKKSEQIRLDKQSVSSTGMVREGLASPTNRRSRHRQF